MKMILQKTTSLLILSILIFSSNLALAATDKVEGTILEATVNLYCSITIGNIELTTTGTGVIIDDRGIILTNAHVAHFFLLDGSTGVLETNCDVRTGSPARVKYDAKVLYIPNKWLEDNIVNNPENSFKGTGENDFALLYITEVKRGEQEIFPSLVFSTSTVFKKNVLLAGYPSEDLKYNISNSRLDQVLSESEILQLQTFNATTSSVDVLKIDSSEAGHSGASGGPVTNMDGEVIGVITTKSSAKVDPTIHAITLSYIDRTLQNQIGLNLSELSQENLYLRSLITKFLLPENFSNSLLSAIEVWTGTK